MPPADLRHRVAERFRELNGDHPMGAVDDEYVTAQFVVLEELCAAHGRDVDDVRASMLDNRLPLPGYLRSDGAEMVPADLFSLADAAGADHLQEWFVAQWADPATGNEEWNAYLSGQYVCLHSVTPTTIQRKDLLVTGIKAEADRLAAGGAGDATVLHALIDELDALEPQFTAYDRVRFGGPTSRDSCITGMRARFPLHSAAGQRSR